MKRRPGAGIAAFVLLFALTGLASPAAATTPSSYSWGENNSEQLGNGTATDTGVPTPVSTPAGVTFTSMSGGLLHACALTSEGAAYCWGANLDGQLGDGSTTSTSTPTPVSMPAGVTFTSISAGGFATCALTAAGAAYCWGNNTAGQLGDNSTAPRNTPTAVVGPGGASPALSFTSITTGLAHACALTAAGAAYCWGDNTNGQLGNSPPGAFEVTPTAVDGPGGASPALSFTSITAGAYHTCAITAAGAAYCWGDNASGQLGDNSPTQRNTPTAVVGPGGASPALSFTSITAGGYFTCALTAAGAAYCWGANASGQLGTGNTVATDVPAAVSGVFTWSSISAGQVHTCAVTAASVGYCWGDNASGQLGNGPPGGFEDAPTAVAEGLTFTIITTGSNSYSSYGILRSVGPNIGPGEPTVFRFLLPDGRECAAISPVLVEVGTMVTLPGVDANCRTMPGASVQGWTIPVLPGFTGFGSNTSPFPPGLSVRVVESQRFTVVPYEPVLTFHYDANVAAVNPCVTNNIVHTRGRIADVWVPRADVGVARFPTQAACTPPGHSLAGWNTRGDGTGTTYQPGAALPTEWARAETNTRTLFATWKPVAGTMPTVDRASAQEALSIAQERGSSRQR